MFKYSFIFIALLCIGCNTTPKKELPNTPEYTNLIGQWQVTQSDLLPFEHQSYCKQLGLESVFAFDKYGKIKIYGDKKEEQFCNLDQKFWIKDDKLVIFEDDFGFDYQIVSLTSEKLILHTDHMPAYLFENSANDAKSKSFDITRLQDKGITIQLSKIQ
ncbi:hypothetical protein [Aquimarina brevivitae]|uniref:Lipocalin-like protein n=1 Tax=Aquimarina brevivitae TaxID=323412 RepID=A0A4Q7NZL8_9FLAO|nr:hypothetical protein [Aquimarina brevivitae]RZS92458.1 hypothetical protein EV197_2596 [Aquimarina brevivitae]